MKSLNYKRPVLNSYSTEELIEIIGPIQLQYLAIEGWRGTKLERQIEYRVAENQNDIKIVQINKEGGIKNV